MNSPYEKAILEVPGFQIDLRNFLRFPDNSVKIGNLPLDKHHSRLFDKFTSGDVGFFDWPVKAPTELTSTIQSTALSIRKKFDAVLLVGIGGSYLGAAAITDALADPNKQDPFLIHWLSNVDISSLTAIKRLLAGKKTACVLISKSGNTIETLSALYECHRLFDQKHIHVVTDPKAGELRALATKFGWNSFPVPENIGGRFSVFTPVGLFPIELAGIDCREVLAGARQMHDFLVSQKPSENPAYLYAAAMFLWTVYNDKPIHVLMPYDTVLTHTADWFVQLWAESIGKKRRSDQRGVGFTPIRCLGTLDQHSQLQLFKEGPRDKCIGFIDILSNCAAIPDNPYVTDKFRFLTKHSVPSINREASLAVEKSLNLSGTPTYRFQFPSLNPQTLGSFLFFQMVACAFAGELFDVNAFDQPGVEEAKQLMRAAL